MVTFKPEGNKTITLDGQCKHILDPILSYGHPDPHNFLTDIVIYKCKICGFTCIKNRPKGLTYIKPESKEKSSDSKILTFKRREDVEPQRKAA